MILSQGVVFLSVALPAVTANPAFLQRFSVVPYPQGSNSRVANGSELAAC
jgi:hypothetical protein